MKSLIAIILVALICQIAHGQMWSDSALIQSNFLDQLILNQVPKLCVQMPESIFDRVSGRVSINHQLSHMPQDSSRMTTAMFTTVHGSMSNTVLGLPITINMRLGARGSEVIRSVSGMNVQFDVMKFRKMKIGKKMGEAANLDDYINALPGSRTLDQGDRTAIELDLKQRAIGQLLADSNYQRKRVELQNKMEVYLSCLESTSDRMQDTLGFAECKLLYQKFTEHHLAYDSLTIQKAKYTQKVENMRGQLTESKLESSLLKKGGSFIPPTALSLPQKILCSFESFEVGTFSYRLNDFAMNGLPQKGIRLQSRIGKFFVGASYGAQNLASTLSVWSYSSYWDTINSGRILVANVGVGNLDSNYIRLAYVEGNSGNKVDSSALYLPRQNRVMSFEIQKGISKALSVKFEMANSHQNYFRQTISETYLAQGVPMREKAAMSYTLAYSPKWKQKITLRLGYQYVGPWFYTIGNPYLLNNRNGLKASARISLYNNKLVSEIGLLTALSRTNRTVNAFTTNNAQLNGNVMLNLKSMKLTFMAAPSRVVNYSHTQRSQILTTLYTGNAGFSRAIRKVTIATNLSVSNFSNDAMLRDTSFSISNLLSQASISLGHAAYKDKIVIGALLMKDRLKPDSNVFSFDAGYANKVKKSQITTSLIYSKLPFDQTPKGGLRIEFVSKFRKSFALGLRVQYRNELANQMSSNSDIMGGINANYSF